MRQLNKFNTTTKLPNYSGGIFLPAYRTDILCDEGYVEIAKERLAE